jgi:predicted ATPase/class 3 adenylate cyclase/DNA-binding winged helix-turn-helix (wHTH) protein
MKRVLMVCGRGVIQGRREDWTMRYAFGDYTLDTDCYELRRAGTLVKLRPKVLELLAYLIAHRECLVAKPELLEHLWPALSIGEATLNSCIGAARQAVGDTGQAQRIIQTRHGRGFRFVAEIAVHRQELVESARPPSPARPSPLVLQDSPVAGGPVWGPEDQELVAPERPTAAVVDAEHKAVTVLCAGVGEATVLAAQLGPEAMYRLMQACLATAQQGLPPYGGTLTHITGGGFVALFGAPRAQEDHARRAVLAAVALQQALQASTAGVSPRVPLAIGVHTGPVVVGGLDAESQRLYTAEGETLTLASRLRQRAAPGAILLSATTQQLVQAEMQVDDGGTLRVAEEAAPIPVYQVHGIVRRRSGVLGRRGRALSRFVGRARELAMLHERVRHAAQGQGQVLAIAGEPGIGKSRLLYEFAQSLGERPVTYCEGHCLAYGSAMPYLPIRDLLRQLCGIAEADGPEAITRKVHAQLRAVDMMPADEALYLLQVLGLTAEGDPLARLSLQAIGARTFATLQQVCRASSRQQPLILAVENLHWIDPTSEEWLTALVERMAGAAILVLLTYRPGYRPAWLGQSNATQIALPRLTANDSLGLVQSVPQSAHLPDHLRQAIVDKAAGNPFFLEELTRAVGEHGRPPAPLRIPDTIQAVLAARIDRLPPLAKRLLQAAAVLGVQVSVPLLQAISEMPEDIITGSLRHLQSAEFLYETRLVPEPAYAFTHVLTQEVAYGSLLHERRCAIHAQIVDALERRAPDRLLEQVDQLAHHAFHGELWDKAVTYGQQAGAKALARWAYREAVGYFEQALSALSHVPETRDTREQAIDLRLALRTALYPSGDWERILALLREAEALAAALDDPRRLRQVSAFLALQLHNRGMYDQAITAGQHALALATASGDIVLEALANQYLGVAYQEQGDYHRAIACLGQSIAFFAGMRRHERFGQLILPAVFSRAKLAWCQAELGLFAEGRALVEEGLRIAETAAHPGSLLYAAWGIGELALSQGDLPRALPRLERALSLCLDMAPGARRPPNFIRITAALGAAYMLDGRVAEAELLLTRALEQSAATEDGPSDMRCHLALGEAQVRAGRLAEAYAHAESALALARKQQEWGHQAYTLRLLGEIAARREPPEADQAEAHYSQVLALAEELGMRPLLAHCHLGLGTLYTQVDRRAEARAELSTAIALYRAMDMTFWLPGAEAALAGVTGSESRNR